MSIVDLVSIRELTVKDVNFILDSSIQCLSKYTKTIVKGQEKSAAISYLETIILYVLHKMAYSIFIACDRDNTDAILGYIVADTQKNHIFLQYTKYNYRKLGVQKNLLLPLVVDPGKPHTVNWPTREMLRYASEGRIKITKQTEMDMADMLYELQSAE